MTWPEEFAADSSVEVLDHERCHGRAFLPEPVRDAFRPSNLLTLVQRDGLARNRGESFAFDADDDRVPLTRVLGDRGLLGEAELRHEEELVFAYQSATDDAHALWERIPAEPGERADVDSHRAASVAWIDWRQSPAPSSAGSASNSRPNTS